jgi:hypothetical protein
MDETKAYFARVLSCISIGKVKHNMASDRDMGLYLPWPPWVM